MADLEIPELAIVVAAQQHNPTILSAEFLAYNDIVPGDWTPSEDRFSTPVLSQVDYEDQGVSISCQPDKIVFTRANGDIRNSTEPDVAALAIAYVSALPHVQYTEVAIMIDGHVVVEQGMEEARRQVIDHYVAKGPWCDYGNGVEDAMVNLAFKFEGIGLRVAIFPALFVVPAIGGSEGGEDTEREIPVIRYSANFQIGVEGEGRDQRIANLVERLGRWREWLETYLELVEQRLMVEIISG
jgi:hypothetical protein